MEISVMMMRKRRTLRGEFVIAWLLFSLVVVKVALYMLTIRTTSSAAGVEKISRHKD